MEEDLYLSWKEEQRSVLLYHLLAKKETGSKQQMFQQLAEAAQEQAVLWAKEMEKKGAEAPKFYQPDLRTRIVIKLIEWFNAKQLRYILSAVKIRGMSAYISTAPGHVMPTSLEDIGLRHKKVSASGNLRAAVFGINDGLISNASLIMGMAGADASSHTIMLAGIAGLLAGAFSMAAGEYISVRSQKEMIEHQIALEKKELELYPEEEGAELALIYQARGLSKDEAIKLAEQLISNPARALEVLTLEELGLNPAELASPVSAGIFSFIFFTLGALIPLLPFLLSNSYWSAPVAIVLTAISLFSIGMLLSLFTGCQGVKSGLRMLLIGAVASGVTYFIGHLLQL